MDIFTVYITIVTLSNNIFLKYVSRYDFENSATRNIVVQMSFLNNVFGPLENTPRNGIVS